MVLDPPKRQKKVERRKANAKSKHESRDQKIAAYIVNAISSAPFLHCCLSSVIWEQGMGQVLFSRLLPNRQVVVATFLLDMFCLGVKDAMFVMMERLDYYDRVYGRLQEHYKIETLDPTCARKLVEGGVEYARKLGIPPHTDYTKAKTIFGDVDSTTCTRNFEYGKDGKPYFASGPFDTKARCIQIINALTARCGVGGFQTLITLDLG